MTRRIAAGLNAVILAVTDDEPRVLTVATEREEGLPYGPLDPDRHPTLERGLMDWVREQTGLHPGYVEQLYTFGDRDRDPGGGERHLSIVYLALAREMPTLSGAGWRPVYEYLPWEDWRVEKPAVLSRGIEPALERWTTQLAADDSRRVRCQVAFGLAHAPWDGERALKRYELLYEAGLVDESAHSAGQSVGRPMILDHRRMLATALSRVRGKIRYRPVIFELLPELFTLWQLQRVAEALAGQCLHKQNFRRLVSHGGLVEASERVDRNTGGRPARLFRFRADVVRERPAPGVGLPRLPAI